MDPIIRRFDYDEDKELNITHRGVAYQRDMKTIAYGEEYFEKCASYDPDICKRVIDGRIGFVDKHWGGDVLDIGAGAGDFVLARKHTKGFDVNPSTREFIGSRGLYDDSFERYGAFTFWDTLEHVDDPSAYFKHIKTGSIIFVSVPVFKNLHKIRLSKHYRPNEHLYYFTEDGLINWLGFYGFTFVDKSDHEIRAGREDVYAYAFKRERPDYKGYISLYSKIHSERYYGASSNLYLDQTLSCVERLEPGSILDFGCGRSDLVAHFYRDGERDIKRYDPAITEYKTMPDGTFDLVLCCDVMEHIPMTDVDHIFKQIRQKSGNVLFVISTKPSRARLPNGENAHITLLTRSEWMRWITEAFGRADEIRTQWEHVLMVTTWPPPLNI